MAFAIIRKNVMTNVEAYLIDTVEYDKTDESFSTMHSYTNELESSKKFEVVDDALRYIKKLINSDAMLRNSLDDKYFNEVSKNIKTNSFDISKVDKRFNDILTAFAIEHVSTYNRYSVYDCVKGKTIFKIVNIGEKGKSNCIIVNTVSGSNIPHEMVELVQYMMNKKEK